MVAAVTTLAALEAYARGLWAPPPDLAVDEWADTYRQLDPSTSSEPGPWRTARTPYLREPMRALTERGIRRVVLMFASQLGKSEVAHNWIGRSIHLAPMPMLLMQPSDKLARRYSRQRIAPLIAATPVLAALVASPRGRTGANSIELKTFPGGLLVVCGSNAPADLASMPMGAEAFDEVDRFAVSAGTEGDPVGLAEARMTTFRDPRTLHTSSPTLKNNSRICDLYEQSDRCIYEVPCPHCGRYQVLRWDQLKWDHAPTRPETAHYQCEHCDRPWREEDKTAFLAAGRWVSTAPGDGQTRGFTLSALYCPLGWLSWADLVREFLKSRGNVERLQVFWNTRLCLPWEDQTGEVIQASVVSERPETFGLGYPVEVPPRVLVLTAGVDVQADRVEVEVVGWGAGEESWSLAYWRISGDPAGPRLWADLDRVLSRLYRRGPVEAQSISAVAIDTGHEAQRVYEFCRQRRGRRIWPIKGRGGAWPVWPKRPRRSTLSGSQDFFHVGVDAAKRVIYGRLRIRDLGPGYCHFPLGRDAGYFAQLTAEKLVTQHRSGKPLFVWTLPANARNEALDCRVYAYAALCGLAAMGWTPDTASGPLDLARVLAQTVPEAEPADVASPAAITPDLPPAPAPPPVPAPPAARKPPPPSRWPSRGDRWRR